MNSAPNAQATFLQTLANAFYKISDPRDPRGVRHDSHGMIVIIFLGMLARMNYIAHCVKFKAVRNYPEIKLSKTPDFQNFIFAT